MGRRDDDHDDDENQTALFNNSPTLHWSTYHWYYYVTTTDRSTLPPTTDQGLKVKQHWGCGAALRSITQECTRRILGQLHSHGDEAGKGLTLFEKLQGFIFHSFLRAGLQHGPINEDCNAYVDMILLLVMIIKFSSSLKNAKNPAIPTFQHSSSNTLKNTLRQIQRSPHLWMDQKYYSVYLFSFGLFRKVYRLVYKNSEENYANSWGIVVAESKVSSLA